MCAFQLDLGFFLIWEVTLRFLTSSDLVLPRPVRNPRDALDQVSRILVPPHRPDIIFERSPAFVLGVRDWDGLWKSWVGHPK